MELILIGLIIFESVEFINSIAYNYFGLKKESAISPLILLIIGLILLLGLIYLLGDRSFFTNLTTAF